MKAVVYKEPRLIAVEEIRNPSIEEPADAVVRVTSTAICGSDLHMYDGRTAARTGIVLGHEAIGVIEQIGPGVRLMQPGDRVAVPVNVACGFCYNCIRGFTDACLTTNPERAGSAYGYVGMGGHTGAQAELLRVPYADMACLKLPGQPGDAFEDDFVLLADAFPSGFHATEMAAVGAGSRVVVFGAGPVGLLSAYSAVLKGASLVFVVDRSPARLARAESIGCIPIDFEAGDPYEQITGWQRENPELSQSLRPGEEKMPGVECGIDAVGYQAINRDDPDMNDATQVLRDLVRIVNATGNIGVIGVYEPEAPGAADSDQAAGELLLPFGELWEKGITIATGQAPAKRYHYQLRDMIMEGGARPGFVISDRFHIDEAPKAYRAFDKRDEVIKPVISFDGGVSEREARRHESF